MQCTLLAIWSMTLAVNIMCGRGPNNKNVSPVTAKETKVRLDWLIIWQLKALDALYINNKTERLSVKSGFVAWVAKHLKVDWFIVLW